MPKFNSLTEFMEDYKTYFLDNCTECGACFDVCPVIPYTPFKGKDPIEIRSILNSCLEDHTNAKDASAFWNMCAVCGLCK